MTYLVIGSGPAGVAAAHALVKAGRSVAILDAGDTIEPGRMDVFDALAQSEPESWSPELSRRARGAFPVTVSRVPLKPAFGSLFPYVIDDPDLPVASKQAEVLISLALGGLSNSWGACMLPVRQQDISDWPISLADLAPHYEAVLRFVPMAAERDELSELLPLYTDSPGELRRGRQATMVLRHMRRHSAALKAAGFSFGASRLALVASALSSNRCRHSGMCMYGCPYRSIYNSADALRNLVREGKVEYRGGVYVDRLAIADGEVSVHFHERKQPAVRGELRASRVFVACGATSSTRLVLESLGHTQRAPRLHDSQYFLVPMITRRSVPVSVATQGNTLAQVFLEFEDERILERTAHLQIYGYNDLMLSPIAARTPLSPERLERLLRRVLGRLVVIQGFLHSHDSPGITLDVGTGGIRLTGDEHAAGETVVGKLLRRLTMNARSLGMVPISKLVQIGQPGKSNHLGGTLPMSLAPGELDTDTLGRVPRWDRVHLVDAAVLPSVPATTVTLSVMANAHRIASAATSIAD
jgi:choline dehydrogenase-like flavoprotein